MAITTLQPPWLTRETLWRALLLALIYYLLATPAAHIGDSGSLSAIAWPAPAVAIALLWRLPYRTWPAYLLAVFVSMLFVGRLDWLPLGADVGYAALNVFEIAFCAMLGRRFVAQDGDLATIRQLTRFLILLPLLGIALTAALGATMGLLLVPGVDWWQEWRVIMVGNGLAVLLIVPSLLMWRHPDEMTPLHPKLTPRRSSLIGAVATALLLTLSALSSFPAELLRATLALTLVWSTVYGGSRGGAVALLVASVGGVLLTMAGLGPYFGAAGTDAGAWHLQIDLIGLAVLTLFLTVTIRERRRLAMRLEQARRFESLGLLAGGIAHDFNNILGTIGGYAEMAGERLAVDTTSASVGPALQHIDAAVKRGRDLIEQILLATRRGSRTRQPIDLRDAIREAVMLATPLAPAGIAIRLQLPDKPAPVLAHQGQMVRAALNLIRNASQAARSDVAVSLHTGNLGHGAIHIGECPAAPAAWMEVADDGPGIEAERLERLFEPFFSTKGSSGLGLAIVAGIASEHEGGVGVVSNSAGTCFRFALPLLEQAPHVGATADTVAHIDADIAIGNGERVILIDDDAAVRDHIEEALALLGFEPVGYDDAEQALADLADSSDNVALLVTDLRMPGMQGDEVLQRVQAIRPGLPTILCSGELELAAIAHGIQAVALAKPFDAAAFAAAVTAALRGRE